jgi:predicted N-acetyltransferase YhbS
MIEVRKETLSDIEAREDILDAAMGEARFRKTSARLREDRLPADGLALVAQDEAGEIVGTVRLWNVAAGGRDALLLGPLAVAPGKQSLGIGGLLMRAACARAEELGHGAILLVGDAPYYERFGFSNDATAKLRMPGPYERSRFLARELVPGALAGAAGVLRATGVLVPVPAVADALPLRTAA